MEVSMDILLSFLSCPELVVLDDGESFWRIGFYI